MKETQTKNIQLAALLLAKIPGSEFRIGYSSSNSRHTILISFSEEFQSRSAEVVDQFHRCEAHVSLFTFNAKLNLIRDAIKGGSHGKRT